MAIVAHSHPFVIGGDTHADDERMWVRDDGHGRSLFLPRDGAWSRSPSGRYRSGKRSLRGKSVMGHGPWVGQSPDEVTEVGRTVPAAPARADNSTGRHRQSGPIASRVTPGPERPAPILTSQSQTSHPHTHRWPRCRRWRTGRW